MKKLISIAVLSFFAAVALPVPAFAQEAPATEKKAFSWESMFPDGLIKAGEKSNKAKKDYFKTMAGKFVGVYSSASWCGPCRTFTPRLVKFYKKNQKEIEIVFSSADKTEKAMQSYAKKDKMKWLAVPFGKRANSKSSNGIPHLIIYTPDGKAFTEISGSGEKSFNALEALPQLMKEWKKTNKQQAKAPEK